ncbi:MAG: hypothetical protein NC092_10055, partial [Butyrivibrio sp.]|nr:hypothetical protein [Muribaculum sp.]MCM1553022.1 hypothetical protein [Butyrivibrio sp.]
MEAATPPKESVVDESVSQESGTEISGEESPKISSRLLFLKWQSKEDLGGSILLLLSKYEVYFSMYCSASFGVRLYFSCSFCSIALSGMEKSR